MAEPSLSPKITLRMPTGRNSVSGMMKNTIVKHPLTLSRSRRVTLSRRLLPALPLESEARR